MVQSWLIVMNMCRTDLTNNNVAGRKHDSVLLLVKSVYYKEHVQKRGTAFACHLLGLSDTSA